MVTPSMYTVNKHLVALFPGGDKCHNLIFAGRFIDYDSGVSRNWWSPYLVTSYKVCGELTEW